MGAVAMGRLPFGDDSKLAWAPLPDLPSARCGAAVVQHSAGGPAVILGGTTTGSPSGALDEALVLDMERGWSALPRLPLPLEGASAVSHAGAIFVAGGAAHSGSAVRTAMMLDPRADHAWRRLGDCVSARHRASACVDTVGQRWWLCGGGGGSGSSEWIDLRLGSIGWASGPALAKPRAGAGISFSPSMRALILTGGDRFLGPCVTGARRSVEYIDVLAGASSLASWVRLSAARTGHVSVLLSR